jgi:hypothetical protein
MSGWEGFTTDDAWEMVAQWRQDIHDLTGEHPSADMMLLCVTLYFQIGCMHLNLKDAMGEIARNMPDYLHVTLVPE